MITSSPTYCQRCGRMLPGQNFIWGSSIVPEFCTCNTRDEGYEKVISKLEELISEIKRQR